MKPFSLHEDMSFSSQPVALTTLSLGNTAYDYNNPQLTECILPRKL